MKHKIKLIIYTTLSLLFLSGCGKNEEYIDVNAWKDKLIQPTEKEITVVEDIKDAAESITENVSNAVSDTADAVSGAVAEGTEIAKDASTDIYELLGKETKDNGWLAKWGETITNQIKSWGKEGTDNVASNKESLLPDTNKNNESLYQDEVNIKDTTLEEDAKNSDTGRVQVNYVRAVDGDTIIVSYQGDNLRVRLIGVNTPESVHEDESKNTEEGKIASDFTKSFMQSTAHIWLELDADAEDDYGRILAYVWLNNSGSDIQADMLNGILLKEDYAEVMTIEPNTKYTDEFEKIAAE